MRSDRQQASKGPVGKPGADDTSCNPTDNRSFADIAAARFSRRAALQGLVAAGAVAVVGSGLTDRLLGSTSSQVLADNGPPSQFKFKEIAHGVDEKHHVADGYNADVLIRWGDPVTADAPAFDPMKQSAAAQAKQFGYNCDFIGFIPLQNSADQALLWVNHEYTQKEIMFPNVSAKGEGFTKEHADIELAAHGGSIVEIRKQGGKWQVAKDSRYNRRITGTTPMRVSGPAAGNDRLKTKTDPTGASVLGMLNNCAGGQTPWGTFLSAEENFNGYFWNKAAIAGHAEEKNLKRYGAPGEWYEWGKFHDRFDIAKEPNEANRFGWVVEVDPMDPASVPVKRTALGRFKHEGAESIVNRDGRLVIYSGDDEANDYVYKFVSSAQVNTNNRAANANLLDSGTLYVAQFADDGSVTWLPLSHGQGPLTEANGFKSQADVLIETRRAADLLKATPMDRPEDIDPNPKTGKVYLMLTNNSRRKPEEVNKANPRANNEFGQIIEITPEGGDHTATKAKWDMLIVAGDPKNAEHKAKYHPATSENGWFGSPDNSTVDPTGRLWISTDQGSAWPKTGSADGVYAVDTEGAARGYSKMFFRVPVGAEMCGPKFTPDGRTLFVAVQHPAADGPKAYKPFGKDSTFADPATRWPDFKPDMPPRPSVVAITKQDGGVIGS